MTRRVVNEIELAPLWIGTITRDWRLVLVRGVAALLFGVLCLAWPAISLLALVVLWGAYALVDGIGSIIWGVRSRWLSMVAVGAISVAAGLIVVFWPGITALALLYVIAAWAVARGVAEIVAAVRLRRRINNEWLLVVAGIISIVFGVLVALFPGAGALAMVWAIGLFAIVFGAFVVVLSLRLRGHQRNESLAEQKEEAGVGVAGREHTPDEYIR